MSKGKAIFHALCAAPDLERAVTELPAKDFLRLRQYLLRTYTDAGVSG